ncbi:helix-turn-helix domain-containing protein [Actinacidiphila reveromycinica]|uniref:helix-turn-helix domain-containing protein n=1 Tax=Actinacidiphila reveromycinica TaxID=659352 RepID=UPI001920ACDC|nr:XRE family transcriptional regulator [Streptomyces sp. SN-593]
MGRRVREERERAGYGQRALAELAGFSQPTLHRIELGTRAQVTLAELDRLADALDVPVRQLTTGSPVRGRVHIAARIDPAVAEDDKERALRLVVEVLELDARLDGGADDAAAAQQHRRRLTAPRPIGTTPEEQGRELATHVRSVLGLGTAPVADVDELIEHLTGVDTAVLRLPQPVDGFTVTDPARDTTLIAVRACDVPERQRFTFAHELGHLLQGDGAEVHQLGGARTPTEQRCDAFARHLLAPLEGIRTWLGPDGRVGTAAGPSVDERTAALLARHFRVSFPVMLIQLECLDLISTARKDALKGPTGVELSQRYGWGPAYEQEIDVSRTVRPPRRILERAVSAYRGQRIGVRVLAMLEGRGVEETQAALREAGLVPEVRTAKRADVTRLAARSHSRHESGDR